MSSPLPLLLLPGLDGTARLFDPLIAALPPSVRPLPIAYPTTEILGYPELEALVTAQLPEGPFALLGESFSGPVALRIAAKRPPGLRAVVLTASFIRSLLPRLLRAVARPALFRMRPPDFFLRAKLIGPDASPALVAAVGDAVASVRPEVTAARIREIVDVDATAFLLETQVPILHLRGAQDQLVSAKVTGLLKSVRPDVEMEEIDGPHLLLQRHPAEATAIIVRFLERVLASPAA